MRPLTTRPGGPPSSIVVSSVVLSVNRTSESVKGVELAVVRAHVDGAVGGQDGRAVYVSAQFDRPAKVAVGLERVEPIVFRTKQDRACGIDQRRREDAIPGAKSPLQGSVRFHGVEEPV